MPHQEHGHLAFLPQPDQRVRARPDLGGPAGDGVETRIPDGLDGVDNQDSRGIGLDGGDNVGQIATGDEAEGPSVEPQPSGPPRDLREGLLARGEEAGVPGPRQARRQLEEKGGLADAGRPCQEDHRAGNQAAAKHSIDARKAGLDPAFLQIGKEQGNTRSARSEGRWAAGASRMFGHRPPATARRALPGPLRGGPPALLAGEQPLDLSHPKRIWTPSDTP